MQKILHFPILLACLCQAAPADDFNRPNVGYTNSGGSLGWYWQAKGTGTWSMKDQELYVSNADASIQQTDQILYHTRVSLQSGNWSASVDVRDETSTRRVGMAFMVGANGTNFYQIRLQFGSRQVQVLENGAAGVLQTIYTSDTASSEVFNTANYYTISAWSTAAGQINWTVHNAGTNVNWFSRRTSVGIQVASGSFADTTYTTGYAGIIKSVGDGVTDVARFDNFYVREITVPPITQARPRLLVTPADILEIKAAINAQVEPRYSAWLNLKLRADSWSSNPVATPYAGLVASEFYDQARVAGSYSSKMALAYLLNGTAAHRDKAKAILLAWAGTTSPRLPGSEFSSYADGGMLLSRSINGFAYTYDFLYNELSPTERTTVETWFRAMLPTIQKGINAWNTPYAPDPNGGYSPSSNLNNRYFLGQLYQNQAAAMTMGNLLIGFALGDPEVVQFALDHKDNPRSYLTLYEGNILMSGEVPKADVCPDDPMTPPPQDGEIFDRYRHIDTSVSLNGTGLAYTALSRNIMTSMTEILYNHGFNFYTRTGAHGENMVLPFNFYADFYRLGDASIKGGYYTGEGVAASYQVAVFEVANKRYPGNPEITALLNSVNRVTLDVTGDMETYFCYPTLTHGLSSPALTTKLWTGEVNSIWDTTAFNWSGETWADGKHAVFGATGVGAITVSGTRSVGNLTLSNVGYSFSGGILSVANLSAANTWTINNNATIASGVTTNFSGGAIPGTLNKLGAGTLTLSGAVNATGFGTTGSGNWGITVSAGSLVLSGTSTFSNAGLLASGGDATISGGTHNFTGSTSRRGLAMGGGKTVTVSGGTVNTVKILVGNGGSGIYTQSGGTVIIPTTGVVELGTAGTTTATSVFNLDGGILQAVQLAPAAGWLGTTMINLNGGTFRAVGTSSNLFSATVTGSQPGSVFVKAGGVLIDSNTFAITIAQNMQAHVLSPGGGLTKQGLGKLTLSGTNNYTGDTAVTGGILAVNGSSIANGNKLIINGGIVEVTGTEIVGSLVLGAVTQASGTYGSTASSAIFKNNTYFSGTGVVDVRPVIIAGSLAIANYSTWASANADSQTADLDSDKDGVSNGVEYFMGQTGSTFTANPSVVTVGAVSTVTWPRDPAAVATFKVQISDTLAAGGWTDIVPPDASIDQSNPNQITYTLPSGAPKKFCRLSVSP